MFDKRLAKLRKKITDENLDAFLISTDSNRFYMSGFHGSNGLLHISPEKAVLFTDFRYTEQATKQAPDYEIVQAGQDGLYVSSIETLGESFGKKVGIEKAHTTLTQLDKMQETFGEDVKLIPLENMVEEIRKEKDPGEIDLIKMAQRIAEESFDEWLGMINPEMTEANAATELEICMKRNGSGPIGFEVIVGAGPNAALPHHAPDDTVLGKGRSIVVDFGASYAWYNSDTTRTIFFGSVPDDLKEIYDIVLDAQQLALDALDRGKGGMEIDSVARDFISKRGHGEHFGHGLGHGIGIDVHEGPTLSAKSEDILEPYNIFSVEPGIYVPDLGGVRIEDLCWLTPEGGYEDITGITREIIVL